MPLYEYACDGCGRFERWRHYATAGEPADCPHCGTTAPRVFGPPFVRSPAGPFAGAGRTVRERVERSHTGEPVRTETAPRGPSVHHVLEHGRGHRHTAARPWLMGH